MKKKIRNGIFNIEKVYIAKISDSYDCFEKPYPDYVFEENYDDYTIFCAWLNPKVSFFLCSEYEQRFKEHKEYLFKKIILHI